MNNKLGIYDSREKERYEGGGREETQVYCEIRDSRNQGSVRSIDVSSSKPRESARAIATKRGNTLG